MIVDLKNIEEQIKQKKKEIELHIKQLEILNQMKAIREFGQTQKEINEAIK